MKMKTKSMMMLLALGMLGSMSANAQETVTIGSTGVSTFSSTKNLDFSGTGIEVYVCPGIENGVTKLNKVDILPAGTGAYIKGAAKSYSVPETTKKAYYANVLKAVDSEITINATDGEFSNITLGKKDGKVAWWQLQTSAKVTAGKAYMQLPTWALGSYTARAADINIVDQGNDEITISAAGAKSYSSKRHLDFSKVEGLKAYIAAGYTEKGIILNEVKYAPAHTGLYLKGDAGTYTVDALKLTAYYENLLTPVIDDTTNVKAKETIDGIEYQTVTLGKKDGVVGWYAVASDVAKIAGGSSFMRIPSDVLATSGARLNLIFNDLVDETTGIEEVSTKAQTVVNNRMYNLSGQEVKSARKGLYIQNGRKVLK